MIGDPIKKADSAEKKVSRWLYELQRGIKRRKKEHKRWDHNESYEDLKQHRKGDELDFGGPDCVTINKVGASIRTKRATIAPRNPRAKMKPRKASGYAPVQVPLVDPETGLPQQDEMGQIVTRPVIRYKLRESLFNDIIGQPMFGLTDTISRVVKAAELGYGAIKVGYTPTFETALPKSTDQMIPINEDGTLDFSGYQMNPVTGMPQEDDDGNLIPKAATPTWESWFIKWQHYRHLIIDPDGGNDFMDHRWVACESIRTLDEVKKDPLFKNTTNLKSTGRNSMDDEIEDREDHDYYDESNHLELVRLFEIYDFVEDKLIVLADGHGKFLRNEPMPLGITHSPFAFYRPNEILGKNGEFYPRPPVSDKAPINDLYNEERRLALALMRRTLRKLLMNKKHMTPDAVAALKSNEDMEIVGLDWNNPYDLQNAVHVLAPPPISGDVFNNMARTERDFDEVDGHPGESRGAAVNKTATGVNQMKEFSGARDDFDRTLLVNCLKEAFKKLNDSIDANMTVERAIEIEGEDGQAFMALVDRDMIAGDFDIEIDIQEMAPANDQMLAANRLQLMQIAGQSPWMFSNETVARGWCDMFQIKDENFIKSLVQGAQMQMQALAAPAQPKSPEAPPPGNEADAIAQMAAGGQSPAMQGAG